MRLVSSLVLVVLTVASAGCDDDSVIVFEDECYRPDVDGDGLGDYFAEDICVTVREGSEAPDGLVEDTSDCDDADASVGDRLYFGEDADGDGFAAEPFDVGCEPEQGHEHYIPVPADARDDDDCDDSDPDVNPSAVEVCDDDGVDEDCDGRANGQDPEGAEGATEVWPDLDQDRYGDSDGESAFRCGVDEWDSLEVDNNLDCDDTNELIHPDTVWYLDYDADGFGDDNERFQKQQCEQPTLYVLGANLDRDGELVEVPVDCDDTAPDVHPDATETCNGIDDNCDEVVDDDDPDVTGTTTFFRDSDGDGHGTESTTADSCAAPDGYVATADDCNDLDAAISPDADEICDSGAVDENCDGATNDGTAVDALTFFEDADGDGYGLTASTVRDCALPAGYASAPADCDDTNSAVSPGASELCSTIGVDDNCNGSADEATAADATTWYLDDDGDGWGDLSTATRACAAPTDHLETPGDCDDTAADIHPGALELCDESGVDEDCDGDVNEDSADDASLWFVDADDDGWGDASEPARFACEEPALYADRVGDCDDGNAGANPGEVEVCDSADVDEDCDGLADDEDTITSSTSGAVERWEDRDGDTYGNSSVSRYFCDVPTGWVDDDTDCSDLHDHAYPGSHETEVPGDGIDTDCDGDDFCHDLNCDGWPDIFLPGFDDGDSDVTHRVWYYDPSKSDYTTSNTDAWIVSTGAVRGTAADVDEDGYLDLLFANHSRSGGTGALDHDLHYGGARGYTSRPDDSVSMSNAYEVCVADFNADGYNDWFVTGAWDGDYDVASTVWWGSASGFTTSSTVKHHASEECDVADLDDDGYPDIVVPGLLHSAGAHGTSVFVFWGSTSGLSDSDRTILTALSSRRVVIADLDNDGDLDIVSASRRSDTSYSVDSYVFWNKAGFRTSDSTALPTHGPNDVAVADLDDDGYPDLVFPGHLSGPASSFSRTASTYIYWGSSSGYSSSSYATVPSNGGGWGVSIGDFNSDGDPDIGVAQYANASTYEVDSVVYYGDGTRSGYSTSDMVALPTEGGRMTAAGDLNLDGYDDFVVTGHQSGAFSSPSPTADSFIYWGSSTGLSTSSYTALPGYSARELVVAGKDIAGGR